MIARILFGVSGLLGASGVAAAAAANHAGGALLAPLALIALTHAPALLALALCRPASTLMQGAALALAAGALMFCADLAARYGLGTPLFPFAAPLGGMLMIGGWLFVALSALRKARS